MTIGKHRIFIGTGGRDAESAKTSFQTIRCVMESLRWHNWWQTTSRQTPGESGLCLQWTNPFNDSYCLMYDKYSLSRLGLPTTVELSFKRCVIRMVVLFLVNNSSLNSFTFLTHLLYTLKNIVFVYLSNRNARKICLTSLLLYPKYESSSIEMSLGHMLFIFIQVFQPESSKYIGLIFQKQ